MRAAVDEARAERDTVGGLVEVRAQGVPPGLGSYATKEDRLDARLAFAVMGIQAVKGVEIGDGFALAGLRGSQAHDEIRPDRRRDTNHAGGIEAGVSNGEEIVVRAAMKPLPTLMKPLASVDLATGEAASALVERSDVAAVEALAVVAEAAVAWELAAAARDKFGGDALVDFVAAQQRVPRAHRMALNASTGISRWSGSWARARRRWPRRWPLGSARPVIDADRLLEGRVQLRLAEFFAKQGETEFRIAEAALVREALGAKDPAVIALGGGAVTTPTVRTSLAGKAFTVLVEVDVDAAWQRVARQRPPARAGRERRFGGSTPSGSRSTARSRTRPSRAATSTASCWRRRASTTSPGALERLGELVPGDGPVALVADATVLGLHGAAAHGGARRRLVSTHEVPAGEAAKQLAVAGRLWSELTLDRDGTVVALGGGSTTDLAAFVAATYLRGIAWVAVPTTLVGQVDAGIGGKTAIDLPEGKNLVGAFHWPARVVIDETLLATLPERERRQGTGRARQDRAARRP